MSQYLYAFVSANSSSQSVTIGQSFVTRLEKVGCVSSGSSWVHATCCQIFCPTHNGGLFTENEAWMASVRASYQMIQSLQMKVHYSVHVHVNIFCMYMYMEKYNRCMLSSGWV